MILIDMPMPKTCGQCFCAMMDYDYNTVRCRFKYDLCFDANSRDYSKRRLDGCPLHEVTADTDTISRPQWIPVSERLPERGESVLLCDLDGYIYLGHLATGCNYYYADYCCDRIKNVTAWMPLPEPYKDGGAV